MTYKKKRIGQILIEAGILNEQQVQSALTHQARFGGKIGRALCKLGFIEEERMCRILSRILKVPFIQVDSISSQELSHEVLDLLDFAYVSKHHVVPLDIRKIKSGDRLIVAAEDPTNVELLKEIEFKTGYRVYAMISTSLSISRFIAKYYSPKALEKARPFVPLDSVSIIAEPASDDSLDIIRSPEFDVSELVDDEDDDK